MFLNGYLFLFFRVVENKCCNAFVQQCPGFPDEIPANRMYRDAGGNEALGAGLGVVNLFDTDGRLVRRLVSPGGRLNAPWGVALAPSTFGSLGNMLLIGNFGDGVINAYDPTTGVFVGAIADSAGTPLANAGLWGLVFGNGAQNQPVNTLFFTAGPNGGANGLYGRLDVAN